MTTQNSRWTESNAKLHHWLEERHELMIEFNELCALKPFIDKEETLEKLVIFCETLVDYVSALHFEIFEIISEAAEFDHQGDKLTKELMVALLQTTNYALAFNDKYGNMTLDSKENIVLLDKDLNKDLNKLGEQFAERLDYEEQLIQVYNHASHYLEELAADQLKV